MTGREPRQYAGPERRGIDRAVAGRRVVGRARVRLDLVRSMPAFGVGEWYPVLERRPGAMLALEDGRPMAGHVWIEMAGRARHTAASALEIVEDAEAAETEC